jgi:pimeloyl-ACP methyl ester carboxylesterase
MSAVTPDREQPAAIEFDVNVAGGTIRGWQTGAGPPALILHGGPGLSEYTAPLAAELAVQFTAIRFQQRGLEPSTMSGPFDVGQHVADVIAVMDAAGLDKAYVVGHSWGGYLAMHLAVEHQERLLGLVVVDPLGAVGDGGESDLGRIISDRVPADKAARMRELDERDMAGEGTRDDALESLAII